MTSTLDALLEQLHITLTDAPRYAGMDPNYVSRILRGEAAIAPEAFLTLLDSLGLELTVTEKH